RHANMLGRTMGNVGRIDFSFSQSQDVCGGCHSRQEASDSGLGKRGRNYTHRANEEVAECPVVGPGRHLV
ncbi:hypothetical protein FRC05_003523, partial [Tulasnella sp. 425]